MVPKPFLDQSGDGSSVKASASRISYLAAAWGWLAIGNRLITPLAMSRLIDLPIDVLEMSVNFSISLRERVITRMPRELSMIAFKTRESVARTFERTRLRVNCAPGFGTGISTDIPSVRS